MLRVRPRIAIAGAGWLVLLTTLAGCVGAAGTGSPTNTTLPALVPTNFVTIAPATTTSVAAPITASPLTPAAAGPTTAPPVVQSPTTAAAPHVDTTVASGAGGSAATGDAKKYTVVAKDTVVGIARRNGVSAQALAKFNAWTDGISHPIYPGDVIKVPAGAATATTAPAGSDASTSTTAAEGSAEPTASTTAGAGGTYVIVAGDYLVAIAKKNGTTVKAIVAANGWPEGDKRLIVPGQTIKLP